MNIDRLQSQALQLPLSDRWQLVQTLLTSIQQETKNLAEHQTLNSQPPLQTSSTDIPNSWLTKLVGVIAVPEIDITDQYIHYLEEKYQ
jgi:hypothetical protein